MPIDYHLIARAEKLAGQHVHYVANQLALYTLGAAVASPSSMVMAQQIERKLRRMVLEAELALARGTAGHLPTRVTQ